MENLYAEFLLWYHGFTTNEAYEALLNESFLNGTNNILLELEEVSSDLLNTRGRFMRYWDYECLPLILIYLGKGFFLVWNGFTSQIALVLRLLAKCAICCGRICPLALNKQSHFGH